MGKYDVTDIPLLLLRSVGSSVVPEVTVGDICSTAWIGRRQYSDSKELQNAEVEKAYCKKSWGEEVHAQPLVTTANMGTT